MWSSASASSWETGSRDVACSAGAEWADDLGSGAQDRYRFDRLADESRSSI
jgi:hypothetical protein